MPFEAKNIIDTDHLFQMATEIHEILKIKMVGDDPNVYIERANEISSWMATTGKMLADARYHRDKAIKESVLTTLKDVKRSNLPASVMNELIKAECKEVNYLVNLIEQLDKETKYQCDLLRTLISNAKEEKRYLSIQS